MKYEMILIVIAIVLFAFLTKTMYEVNKDMIKEEKNFQTWLLNKETFKKYQGMKEARSAYKLKKFLEERNIPSHIQ